MKTLVIAFLAISSFAMASQAAVFQGRATKSTCQTGSNLFRSDKCGGKANVGACTITTGNALFGGKKMAISINGRTLSSSVGSPYMFEGDTATTTLTFSQTIRGILQTKIGAEAVKGADVYVNMDSSGKVYDLYRCQGLKQVK